MLFYTPWATNELETVLSLIQGAYFFPCTQLEVLFQYFFFLFQISALISTQTRICFDTILFLKDEFTAIQTPNTFFS